MGWKSNREVTLLNQKISNIAYSNGNVEDLGYFLCDNGNISNFIISGGVTSDERYEAVSQVLYSEIGKMPMVILHNEDIHIEAMVIQAWQSTNAQTPLWVVNNRNAEFEPFYGMNEMQVVTTFRQLAVKLNYTVTPRFERVIRAHLMILKELDIPVSLSGLYYLCGFYDMGEFHDNVMALPCGESVARRIWADLGVDSDDGNSQFDLFRAVVNNLANEAEQSGWNPDNNISEYNCLKILEAGGTLVLSVNDMYTDLLMSYLLQELKTNREQQFVLLLDNVKVNDEHFQEYLRNTSSGCICGVIAENVVEMVGGDESNFLRFVERMDSIVLFKHSTGKTAVTLSEIFGKYDYTKLEVSRGTNKGFFDLLPTGRHDDMRYSTENRYRVMPEEIIGLRAGQAIVFDLSRDQIIHFN